MKSIRGNIIYWALIAAFFYVFLCILRFIWDNYVPLNTATDVVSVFIAMFILFPLALFSTEKLLQFITNSMGKEF
jgi:uncharacterized membrane protein